MVTLLLVLNALDKNAPIHAMPKANTEPSQLRQNAKEVVKAGTPIVLVSSHHIQNYTAHLVFSKDVSSVSFSPKAFFGDDNFKPVSVTVKHNTVNLVFDRDVSKIQFMGSGDVESFVVGIAYQIVDNGQEFFEEEEADYINQYRINSSLDTLTVSQKLGEIARVKAYDCLITRYDHVSPTYGDAKGLQEYFQYTIGTLGENIAMVSGFYKEPEWFFLNYRMSKSHNANMLEPKFKSMGVGFAYYNNQMAMVHVFSSVQEPDSDYGFGEPLVLFNRRPVDPDYVFAGSYVDPEDTNWGPAGKPLAE